MDRQDLTHADAYAEVVVLLGAYFDALYHCDVSQLQSVFHPSARYWCATEGELTELDMTQYFPIVAQRASPASRSEERADRIVSIEFAGPTTSLARVQCRIGEKYFTDLLSLVRLNDRWQIISKVFHFDLATD